METKKTYQIEKELEKSKDIKEFLEENSSHVSTIKLQRFLNKLIFDKGSKASELIKRTNIEKSYFYQILNGTRNPGRDKMILIAIALGLDMDETQKLLKVGKAGALYAKDRRDLVLQFCIMNGYSVADTQTYLDDNGFDVLK